MKIRRRRLSPSNLFSLCGLPLSAHFDRPDPPSTDDKGAGDSSPQAGGGASKDVVTLTKAEYAEMVAAKAERDGLKPDLDRLRKFEGHTKTMLRGDLDASAKAESTREVLMASGYTKEQVDAYLGTITGGNEQPGRRARPKAEDEQDAGDEDPNDARIRALEEQNKHLIKSQQEETLEKMKGMLAQSAKISLSDSNGMGPVIAQLKRHAKQIIDDAAGGDASEVSAAQETAKGLLALEGEIENEVRERTTARLQYRRNQTGQWSNAWFAEEASKAAAELVSKYRPLVIGLPNRIGRASGTESGEDQFRNVKPVEAPVYKPGMTNATAKSQVTDWAADLLGRAATELSRQHSAV